MSSYSLNGVTAPDSPSSASTIEDVPLHSITIDVVNASIYWQLKLGTGKGQGGVWEAGYTQMTPGSRVITSDTPGEMVGIRFWAVIPAAQIPAGSNQAVVTVRAT